MKRRMVLCAALAINPSSLIAQEQVIKELNSLPFGVTDLTEVGRDVDAGYDMFSKDGSDIDLSDIAGKVQAGSRLYTTGETAILLSEGSEPVLLVQQPDGGVQAMYICRILPICTETPE